MKKKQDFKLSRRQEEILDIIFRLEEASVSDVMKHLRESPTDGSVRNMLNILYSKGAVDFRYEGPKKIFKLKFDKNETREKALKNVIDTFFAGSAARTMASLIKGSTLTLTEDEKQILSGLIKKARNEGR